MRRIVELEERLQLIEGGGKQRCVEAVLQVRGGQGEERERAMTLGLLRIVTLLLLLLIAL
jgi:hypothetical protein